MFNFKILLTSNIWSIIFRYYSLILISILLMSPLFWVITSSFRPTTEIFSFSNDPSWKMLFPTELTLDHYQGIVRPEFIRAIANSLFVALATVVLGVLVNAMAGFAFAVFNFRFKNILFILVLASFMMPFESIIIPLFVLIRALGWTNSFQALILPEVANGLVIFLFRQLFISIPREIYEAALVDGASWFQIFVRIAMPLSGPTIATSALMLFILQWDAFFWPLVVASAPEYTVIQVAIIRNMTLEQSNWGIMFASTTAAVLIAAIPFLFLQRYYVKTIVESGIK